MGRQLELPLKKLVVVTSGCCLVLVVCTFLVHTFTLISSPRRLLRESCLSIERCWNTWLLSVVVVCVSPSYLLFLTSWPSAPRVVVRSSVLT